MTEIQERALKVSAMLTEARVLRMESKRLGRKFVEAGILTEEEILSADDLADREDFFGAVSSTRPATTFPTTMKEVA